MEHGFNVGDPVRFTKPYHSREHEKGVYIITAVGQGVDAGWLAVNDGFCEPLPNGRFPGGYWHTRFEKLEYVFMFPAAYSAQQERFRPCAMTSHSYGEKHGDPHELELRVDPEKVPHSRVMALFKKESFAAVTYVLGTVDHSPVQNPPTMLAIYFASAEDKDRFAEGLAGGS